MLFLMLNIIILSLTKVYAKHAKRLRATGEGVADNSDEAPGSEGTLKFYIGGEGPCVETPHYARNIWSMSISRLSVIYVLNKLFN